MKYIATIVFEAASDEAANFALQNATEKVAHDRSCQFAIAHVQLVGGTEQRPTLILQQVLRPEDFSNFSNGRKS